MSFPHWDLAFPDQEKRFPRVHFAFPHREMAFPTARERDYGNQKVRYLSSSPSCWMNSTYTSGSRDAGCASAGTMSSLASGATLTISLVPRDVLVNFVPN